MKKINVINWVLFLLKKNFCKRGLAFGNKLMSDSFERLKDQLFVQSFARYSFESFIGSSCISSCIFVLDHRRMMLTWFLTLWAVIYGLIALPTSRQGTWFTLQQPFVSAEHFIHLSLLEFILPPYERKFCNSSSPKKFIHGQCLSTRMSYLHYLFIL